jgi:hypothetical protein
VKLLAPSRVYCQAVGLTWTVPKTPHRRKNQPMAANFPGSHLQTRKYARYFTQPPSLLPRPWRRPFSPASQHLPRATSSSLRRSRGATDVLVNNLRGPGRNNCCCCPLVLILVGAHDGLWRGLASASSSTCIPLRVCLRLFPSAMNRDHRPSCHRPREALLGPQGRKPVDASCRHTNGHLPHRRSLPSRRRSGRIQISPSPLKPQWHLRPRGPQV